MGSATDDYPSSLSAEEKEQNEGPEMSLEDDSPPPKQENRTPPEEATIEDEEPNVEGRSSADEEHGAESSPSQTTAKDTSLSEGPGEKGEENNSDDVSPNELEDHISQASVKDKEEEGDAVIDKEEEGDGGEGEAGLSDHEEGERSPSQQTEKNLANSISEEEEEEEGSEESTQSETLELPPLPNHHFGYCLHYPENYDIEGIERTCCPHPQEGPYSPPGRGPCSAFPKTGNPLLEDSCLYQEALGCWMRQYFIQTLGRDQVEKHHDRSYFKRSGNFCTLPYPTESHCQLVTSRRKKPESEGNIRISVKSTAALHQLMEENEEVGSDQNVINTETFDVMSQESGGDEDEADDVKSQGSVRRSKETVSFNEPSHDEDPDMIDNSNWIEDPIKTNRLSFRHGDGGESKDEHGPEAEHLYEAEKFSYEYGSDGETETFFIDDDEIRKKLHLKKKKKCSSIEPEKTDGEKDSDKKSTSQAESGQKSKRSSKGKGKQQKKKPGDKSTSRSTSSKRQSNKRKYQYQPRLSQAVHTLVPARDFERKGLANTEKFKRSLEKESSCSPIPQTSAETGNWSSYQQPTTRSHLKSTDEDPPLVFRSASDILCCSPIASFHPVTNGNAGAENHTEELTAYHLGMGNRAFDFRRMPPNSADSYRNCSPVSNSPTTRSLDCERFSGTMFRPPSPPRVNRFGAWERCDPFFRPPPSPRCRRGYASSSTPHSYQRNGLLDWPSTPCPSKDHLCFPSSNFCPPCSCHSTRAAANYYCARGTPHSQSCCPGAIPRFICR